MLSLLSMFGLVLILAGWGYETYQTLKDRHCDVKLNFALLYFVGSSLLAFHAYVLNDMIFIILNVAAALIALINIYYILFGEKYSQQYKDLLKKTKKSKK